MTTPSDAVVAAETVPIRAAGIEVRLDRLYPGAVRQRPPDPPTVAIRRPTTVVDAVRAAANGQLPA
jgi:hypothetical protein